MPTLLALDFDGVICESVDECHLTALNAYRRLAGERELVTDFAALEPQAVERFRQLRPLARNAPEFWAVVHFTYHQPGAVDVERFYDMVQAESAQLATFETHFFQVRGELRANDPTGWLNLNRMYPQFRTGWEQIKDRQPVFIITTKDRESIRLFNRAWSLGIPDSHLWTKERGTDKAVALTTLAGETGCRPADFLFVDDHIYHAQRVAATGARCFLALWSHPTPGEPVIADDRVTPLRQMADLLPLLS